MAAFIQVRERDRAAIHEFALSYRDEAAKRQKREAEEMSRILYTTGDGSVDGSRYGIDSERVGGFLKAWYLYKGMSVERILSDTPEAQEEKNRLTEEFHNEFIFREDDSAESLNERRS